MLVINCVWNFALYFRMLWSHWACILIAQGADSCHHPWRFEVTGTTNGFPKTVSWQFWANLVVCFPTGSMNGVRQFILLQDSESDDQPATRESGSLSACDWPVKSGHSQPTDAVCYVRAKQAELPSVRGRGTPLDLRPVGRREDVGQSVNQVISLNQGCKVLRQCHIVWETLCNDS